jgi:hypothetical protein
VLKRGPVDANGSGSGRFGPAIRLVPRCLAWLEDAGAAPTDFSKSNSSPRALPLPGSGRGKSPTVPRLRVYSSQQVAAAVVASAAGLRERSGRVQSRPDSEELAFGLNGRLVLMDLASIGRPELVSVREGHSGKGDLVRAGRAVAYAALAIALSFSGLACDSTSTSTKGVAVPAAQGPEGTPTPPDTLVDSVAPSSGADGSQVTISGKGFTPVEAVCFGSALSPQYRVSDSGTRITAVVPPGSGTVSVGVRVDGYTAVNPDATFTYRSSLAASATTGSAMPEFPCS